MLTFCPFITMGNGINSGHRKGQSIRALSINALESFINGTSTTSDLPSKNFCSNVGLAVVGLKVDLGVSSLEGTDVGFAVGNAVGLVEGSTVGFKVGNAEGSDEGLLVGEKVGLVVGLDVGSYVGLFDGMKVGITVDFADGTLDGRTVGREVVGLVVDGAAVDMKDGIKLDE
jgi:hypothetical protein